MERLDFNISSKHKLFTSYHAFYRTEHIRQYFPNVATGEFNPRDTNGAIVDDVYTLTPTMILNTRANWTRFVDMFRPESAGFDMTTLGFPASLASRSPYAVMPRVNFSDGVQALGFNGASKTPFDSYQFFSTLNKMRVRTASRWELIFGHRRKAPSPMVSRRGPIRSETTGRAVRWTTRRARLWASRWLHSFWACRPPAVSS